MKAFKPLVFMALIFFSSYAYTNTIESVFSDNTQIPHALRPKIIKAVEEHISCLKSYSLQELETQVDIDQVDQGVRDEYFTSSFEATAYLDRYHPSQVNIIVKSVNMDIANPRFERYRVQEITPDFFCD